MMGKGEGDCEDFRDGRNCFRAEQYMELIERQRQRGGRAQTAKQYTRNII